jgi:hypothetical protein
VRFVALRALLDGMASTLGLAQVATSLSNDASHLHGFWLHALVPPFAPYTVTGVLGTGHWVVPSAQAYSSWRSRFHHVSTVRAGDISQAAHDEPSLDDSFTVVATFTAMSIASIEAKSLAPGISGQWGARARGNPQAVNSANPSAGSDSM